MINLLLALLPGRLHIMMRRLMGQPVSPGARIGFGSLIQVQHLELGDKAAIGPLTRLRANQARLSKGAKIGPLSLVSAHTVELGRASAISPLTIVSGDVTKGRSALTMGDHSRIFPLCWLEPGHGISLGSRVGVGGHSLIFTHGSWANYFLGAPVSVGPVVIEDRVWLPWRVFVMPNVTIGEAAVVGAGSVITRDIPARALAAGAPAKVLRERAYATLAPSDIAQRLEEVVTQLQSEEEGLKQSGVRAVPRGAEFPNDVPAGGVVLTWRPPRPFLASARLLDVSVIDVVEEKAYYFGTDKAARQVASWLTRFGVRVDEVDDA